MEHPLICVGLIAEILEKVKRPPPLIRPSVSKGVAPPEAINIMVRYIPNILAKYVWIYIKDSEYI